MTDVPKIAWKHLSLEASAIVAIILLAFWIDAVWDQREESARERVVLETLLSDMQEFRLSRETRDPYLEAITESGRSLLDIVNVQGWEDSAYDVDAQINECIALIEAILGKPSRV